jgi:hypothetical protein
MSCIENYNSVKGRIPKNVRDMVEEGLENMGPSVSLPPREIERARRIVYERMYNAVGFCSTKNVHARYFVTALMDAATDLGEDTLAGHEVDCIADRVWRAMAPRTRGKFVYRDEDLQLDPTLLLREEPSTEDSGNVFH